MVTIFTVENAKDVTTAMRGNFIKLVDKKSGDVSITFLNGKGKLLVTLDYDVQAAVLDLLNDRDYQKRLAESFREEVRAIERRLAAIQAPQPAAIPEVLRGDDSLSRWIAYAKVIKGIFVEAR
jgi:streptomycin 6-kinase